MIYVCMCPCMYNYLCMYVRYVCIDTQTSIHLRFVTCVQTPAPYETISNGVYFKLSSWVDANPST